MGEITARIATIALSDITCGECGGIYAISERYRQQCWQEGKSWNCPYCKVGWGYGSDNENARLKRQLDAERKRKEWAEKDAANQRARAHAAELRERGQRAAKTRIKNRIANGVCPCCTRSFANLQRHMANQHPEFRKPEA